MAWNGNVCSPLGLRNAVAELPRLARTLRHLRAPQFLARPLVWLGDGVTRPLIARLGARHAPSARTAFAPASPVFVRYLETDALRAAARIRVLGGADDALATYEGAYARGAAALATLEPSGPSALAPYPASVRARNVALAIRRGRADLASELARCARAVLLQLEWHLLGNHLHENAVALLCAGLVTTGLEADLWYAVGARLLDAQLKEQWLADGGHFERSATYHGWLLSSLLEVLELHRATARPFPAAWQRCLERALSFVVRIRPPDGSWPLLNDTSLDFCPPADGLLELGRDLGLAVPSPTTASMDVLPDTGWVVARAGRAFVIADVAPVGPSVQPGHAHADPLTFELWVGDARTIVDAGVRQYRAGPEREWCRSSVVHNTVGIDGCDSAEVWHSFRVGRRPRVTLLSTEASSSPRWSAEHDGFGHLPGNPIHRRQWALSRDALLIHDEVRGHGEHLVMATIRADHVAADRVGLTVTSDAPALPELGGMWFPRHGEGHRARCFSFGALAQLPFASTLRISFNP